MRPLRLSQVVAMAGGRLQGEDVVVDAIATDTRTLPVAGNALFIALKGERFDAHDHVAAAAQGGVAAALVSRPLAVALPPIM